MPTNTAPEPLQARARARPATEPSPCRSCGSLLLWVEWPSGKKMPVNARPSQDGDIVLALRPSKRKLVAEHFRADIHQGRNRYTSHVATCPHARMHRRAR
jgi:hypothetical protein